MKEYTVNIFQQNIGNTYDIEYADFHKAREAYRKYGGVIPVFAAVEYLSQQHFDKKSIKIIDIGCGMGHDMVLFSDFIKNKRMYKGKLDIIGCDISKKMTEHCVNLGLNVINADCLEIKEELGKSDLVWANLSLIHIPMKKLKKYFEFLYDITNENGLLGIAFKTGNDIEVFEPPSKVLPSVKRPTTYLKEDTLVNFLKEAGYKAVLSSVKLELNKEDEGIEYSLLHLMFKK